MGAESGAADGTEDRRDMRKSFVMYTTWAFVIAKLPDAQAAQLAKAISCYQVGIDYSIEDPSVQAIFEAMIVPKFKEDEAKYQNRVDSIQNARDKKQSETSLKTDCNQVENNMETDRKQSDSNSVTDTVTVTVTDKKKKKSAKARPTRHKRGKFGHVMLSDDELASLEAEHGKDETSAAIGCVDNYCETYGKKYNNYALVLENWGYSAAKEKARGKPPDKSIANGKSPDKPTSFNGNFHQRDYDYDELERKLLEG